MVNVSIKKANNYFFAIYEFAQIKSNINSLKAMIVFSKKEKVKGFRDFYNVRYN